MTVHARAQRTPRHLLVVGDAVDDDSDREDDGHHDHHRESSSPSPSPSPSPPQSPSSPLHNPSPSPPTPPPLMEEVSTTTTRRSRSRRIDDAQPRGSGRDECVPVTAGHRRRQRRLLGLGCHDDPSPPSSRSRSPHTPSPPSLASRLSCLLMRHRSLCSSGAAVASASSRSASARSSGRRGSRRSHDGRGKVRSERSREDDDDKDDTHDEESAMMEPFDEFVRTLRGNDEYRRAWEVALDDLAASSFSRTAARKDETGSRRRRRGRRRTVQEGDGRGRDDCDFCEEMNLSSSSSPMALLAEALLRDPTGRGVASLVDGILKVGEGPNGRSEMCRGRNGQHRHDLRVKEENERADEDEGWRRKRRRRMMAAVVVLRTHLLLRHRCRHLNDERGNLPCLCSTWAVPLLDALAGIAAGDDDGAAGGEDGGKRTRLAVAALDVALLLIRDVATSTLDSLERDGGGDDGDGDGGHDDDDPLVVMRGCLTGLAGLLRIRRGWSSSSSLTAKSSTSADVVVPTNDVTDDREREVASRTRCMLAVLSDWEGLLSDCCRHRRDDSVTSSSPLPSPGRALRGCGGRSGEGVEGSSAGLIRLCRHVVGLSLPVQSCSGSPGVGHRGVGGLVETMSVDCAGSGDISTLDATEALLTSFDVGGGIRPRPTTPMGEWDGDCEIETSRCLVRAFAAYLASRGNRSLARRLRSHGGPSGKKKKTNEKTETRDDDGDGGGMIADEDEDGVAAPHPQTPPSPLRRAIGLNLALLRPVKYISNSGHRRHSGDFCRGDTSAVNMAISSLRRIAFDVCWGPAAAQAEIPTAEDDLRWFFDRLLELDAEMDPTAPPPSEEEEEAGVHTDDGTDAPPDVLPPWRRAIHPLIADCIRVRPRTLLPALLRGLDDDDGGCGGVVVRDDTIVDVLLTLASAMPKRSGRNRAIRPAVPPIPSTPDDGDDGGTDTAEAAASYLENAITAWLLANMSTNERLRSRCYATDVFDHLPYETIVSGWILRALAGPEPGTDDDTDASDDSCCKSIEILFRSLDDPTRLVKVLVDTLCRVESERDDAAAAGGNSSAPAAAASATTESTPGRAVERWGETWRDSLISASVDDGSSPPDTKKYGRVMSAVCRAMFDNPSMSSPLALFGSMMADGDDIHVGMSAPERNDCGGSRLTTLLDAAIAVTEVAVDELERVSSYMNITRTPDSASASASGCGGGDDSQHDVVLFRRLSPLLLLRRMHRRNFRMLHACAAEGGGADDDDENRRAQAVCLTLLRRLATELYSRLDMSAPCGSGRGGRLTPVSTSPQEKRLSAELAARCLPFCSSSSDHYAMPAMGTDHDSIYSFDSICAPAFARVLRWIRYEGGGTTAARSSGKSRDDDSTTSPHDDEVVGGGNIADRFRDARTALYVACHHLSVADDVEEVGFGVTTTAHFALRVVGEEKDLARTLEGETARKGLTHLEAGCVEYLALCVESWSRRASRGIGIVGQSPIRRHPYVEDLHLPSKGTVCTADKRESEKADVSRRTTLLAALAEIVTLMLRVVTTNQEEVDESTGVQQRMIVVDEVLGSAPSWEPHSSLIMHTPGEEEEDAKLRVGITARMACLNALAVASQRASVEDGSLNILAETILPRLGQWGLSADSSPSSGVQLHRHHPLCTAAALQTCFILVTRTKQGVAAHCAQMLHRWALREAKDRRNDVDEPSSGSALRVAALKLAFAVVTVNSATNERSKSSLDPCDVEETIRVLQDASNSDPDPDVRKTALHLLVAFQS